MSGCLEPLSLLNAKYTLTGCDWPGQGVKDRTSPNRSSNGFVQRKSTVAHIWTGSMNEQHHFGNKLETPPAEF